MAASTFIASVPLGPSTSTRAIASFTFDHGTSVVSLRARLALRMRVRRSAMGSVIIRARSYQDALINPGICPFSASWRRQMRHSLKRRKKARGRPHNGQRLCWRTRNLGLRIAFIRCDVRATGSPRSSGGAEWNTERTQQRSPLRVALRGRADVDGEAFDLVDLVDVDLRKDDLLANAERVVAPAVEGLFRDSLEVAHARQRHVHQTIEELVHAIATQRHHTADRQPLAQLEVGDRLLRLGDHRPLARNRRNLGDGRIEDLRVLDGFAEPHVEDDLLEPRHLIDVRVALLVLERWDDLRMIALSQSRRHRFAFFFSCRSARRSPDTRATFGRPRAAS